MKLKKNLLKQTMHSVLTLTMFAFLVSSCKDNDGAAIAPVEPDIVEVAIEAGYTTLAAALTEAGLVDDFQGTGPFTVFAPTNAAFAEAGITTDNVGDIENLEAFLLYHVISGSVTSVDLSTGNVKTLNGKSVVMDASALTLNGNVNIQMPFDVAASNGVIHSIDSILIPPEPTVLELATADEDLSMFVTALKKFSDLVTLLNGEGTYTVFAPTNDAFNVYLDQMGQQELDDIPDDVLKSVLQYHIIKSAAIALKDFSDGQMAATALGAEDMLTFGVSGEGVTVNGANVVTSDLVGRNGIVHVIDAVLIPGE